MPVEPISPEVIKIPNLDPASPQGNELVGEWDDHMRLTKSALKNSFPAIGEGSCSLTAEQINQNYAAITKSCGIIIWWGENDTTNLPDGWARCDGGTYNGIVTPVIESMFLKHGNAEEAQGSVGGKKGYTSGLLPHPLLPNEVPPHNHTIDTGLGGAGEDAREASDYNEGAGDGPTSFSISPIGESSSHEHTFSYDNQPPFFVLRAITYVGVA